jgi:hypothetical protein
LPLLHRHHALVWKRLAVYDVDGRAWLYIAGTPVDRPLKEMA